MELLDPSRDGELGGEDEARDSPESHESRNERNSPPRTRDDAAEAGILYQYICDVKFLRAQQEAQLADEEARLRGGWSEYNQVSECPICLITIRDSPPHCLHVCCGKKVCETCQASIDEMLLVARKALQATTSTLEERQDATFTIDSRKKCEFCRSERPTPSRAIQQLEMHDSNGKLWATHELGCAHMYGAYEFDKNFNRGMSLISKAAYMGHSDSQYFLGYESYNKRSMKDAYSWTKRASDQGHAQAQLFFAHHFHEFRIEHGIEMDVHEVRRLSHLSAAKLNPCAMLYCAKEAEQKGLVNFALYWYIQAANYGSKTCYSQLANTIERWYGGGGGGGGDDMSGLIDPNPLLYRLRECHSKYEKDDGPLREMKARYCSDCSYCGCKVNRKLSCKQW